MGIREDMVIAMYEVDLQSYQPTQLPPLHPADYQAALDRLGLPADHRLTSTEFLDSLGITGAD